MLKYVTVETKKRKSQEMAAAADVKKARNDSGEDDKKDGESASPNQGCEFIQKKGDLFSCRESESLAHCISADVRMGKGIAVLFKNKFGGVKELLDQGQKTGGCAILKRGERYVYYLITKDKYWQKPTYSTLQQSLVVMCEHCEKHGVRRVSMPRIGCGLDGLQWDRVADTIRDVFRNLDITITVYTI